jgi:glucose-6-phosphate isomerase
MWEKYQNSVLRYPDLGFSIDFSRMDVPDDLESRLATEIKRALDDLIKTEKGEIVNPDEGRMVGHYWLRNPEIAPPAEGQWIKKVKKQVADFAHSVRSGAIKAPNGSLFQHVLLIGIGGSALGPQLVDRALKEVNSPLDLHYLDNTDPQGIDDTLARLGKDLAETLVIVISKSGGTPETRNGMLETEARFKSLNLNFPQQTVAVTGAGSKLDLYAQSQGWLRRFEMCDWVGGRTSVMSAVGLLPAALTGIDIEQFLAGAAAFDAKTRSLNVRENAALRLALMWHHAGNGKGRKDMVIIPYCDRLELMSKYLQQLVMESLGKQYELGNQKVVNQGIAVYGNKGSTDQHAYIQQLRDGLNNFFATFIEVQGKRTGPSLLVDENSTSGDYLQGFLRGTRDALYENGRQSITITLSELNAYTLGGLIALYERAVSFYASLINVNAYHQPGVEAGKAAATIFLNLLTKVKQQLTENQGKSLTAETVAGKIGESDVEKVYHCLNHLAGAGFCQRQVGAKPGEDTFQS